MECFGTALETWVFTNTRYSYLLGDLCSKVNGDSQVLQSIVRKSISLIHWKRNN